MFLSCLAGPERPAETLESAANAVRRHVRQCRLLPLSLLRGVVAHRGPPLLQHRKPHGAHERQKLLRHIQIGQPFRVKAAVNVRRPKLSAHSFFDFSQDAMKINVSVFLELHCCIATNFSFIWRFSSPLTYLTF